MPSLPSNEPTVRYRCNLPLTLAAKVELLLQDPIRPGKRVYGEFSKLVSSLLTNYFDSLEKGSNEFAPEVKRND